ncbi:MAG TPA: hypothetical protein VFU21_04910 [Kofleriaceae bacterium]|nr:hypothetical protein [Kofleriaceae bacterium]
MRIGHSAMVAALAASLVGAAGCKKEGDGKSESKADENKAAAAKLTAPALFAHIPADTPYAFAAFDPLPPAYWDAVGGAVKPELEKLLDQMLQMPADEPPAKFALGMAREFRANLNAAGMKKSFGISPDKRWAFYGVGIVPVFRLELDGKALRATVERISKESGFTLPTATAGTTSYYRFEDGEVVVLVAVLDDQLIASGGPKALVDQSLKFIVGGEKPQPSMADGGALKEVTARHGFASYGSGFVDSAKMLKVLMMADLMKSATGGGGMPESCKPQLEALSVKFPRVAFGYDEVSPTRAAMRMILEMEPALVARMKQLEVDVPGMAGGKLTDKALIAFGGGIDVAKAKALASDFADGMAAFGTACGASDMVSSAGEMKQGLSQPLPPVMEGIKGGLVALLSAELTGGRPSNVAGYAYVITDNPGALADMATQQLAAMGNVPKVPKDGKFHDVVPAGAVPGLEAVKAAVKEKAVVVATGAKGTEGAERALAAKGKAPLVFLSYDYGRLLKMGSDVMSQMGNTMPGMNERMAQLFGLAAIWAYVSDHGLAVSLTMEMQPQ